MESLFFDMIQILRQQNQIMSSLLTAAQEHNLALRNNDSAAIMAAVKKQAELSKTLQSQDKIREEIQQRLARQYGLEKQVVLSELIPYATGSTTIKNLEQLSKNLRESLNQLAEINQLNSVLAMRGIQFSNQLLNIILPKNSNTYQGSGELRKDSKPLSTFDKTI